MKRQAATMSMLRRLPLEIAKRNRDRPQPMQIPTRLLRCRWWGFRQKTEAENRKQNRPNMRLPPSSANELTAQTIARPSGRVRQMPPAREFRRRTHKNETKPPCRLDKDNLAASGRRMETPRSKYEPYRPPSSFPSDSPPHQRQHLHEGNAPPANRTRHLRLRLRKSGDRRWWQPPKEARREAGSRAEDLAPACRQ